MSQIETLEDSFLDTAEVAETEETETVETETETAEEPVKTETTETEDSTTESEQTDESEKTEPEEPEKEPKKDWTFSQAMDEREKRQKFERENEELKKQLAAQEKTEGVSVFDDEAGYTAQQDQKVQATIHNAVLGVQKSLALRDLGEDVVTEAALWYEKEGMKSAYNIDRIEKSDTKFHTVVDLYNEEKARQDPEGYKAALKAEILAEIKAETEKTIEPIKPSLAASSSASTEDFSSVSDDDFLKE